MSRSITQPASPRGKSGMLRMCGVALYGDYYIADLAQLLDVDRKTLRGWLSEKRPIPSRVWPVIYFRLAKHAQNCESLRVKLTDLIQT